VVPGGYHLAHQRPSTRATGNGEITLSPATVETPRPPLARREVPIWRRLQTIDGGHLLRVTLGVRPARAHRMASAQSRKVLLYATTDACNSSVTRNVEPLAAVAAGLSSLVRRRAAALPPSCE
jgi:hypothetical protein